ncbi:hypothetical protein QBC47DRAFT_110843 [Echria macrotheca]|uniref:Uncharacterized protein n=1 Tax=Echria macrotheca TaxID=438768 RepID=A0AAJ0BJT1_9PEZI|nr:hypothetical protein QBC47DRAFT_110843 [Echria macrotheca]
MAQTKDALLAPQQPAIRAQVPRLRKKLQKSVTKQQSIGARRLGPGASNEALVDNKCDTANKRLLAQAQSCLPSLPAHSPDHIFDFFRGHGCLHYHHHASPSTESLLTPLNIIPDFAHLAVRDRDAHPRPIQQTPRPSTDSQTRPQTMRRRAKTPIFSIGQLDAIPRPSAHAKVDSVDLIADQYRALLESRNSVYSDSHSEPPPSRQGDGSSGFPLRREQSSDELNSETPIHAPNRPVAPPLGASPTSDDGTLVSFEEETVYFKPVSFSPEPLSPHPQFVERPFPSPSPPAPDNLSLQICLDLLTRDLSSALASRPSRSTPETSALQVWVMIEAYERLRDQLAGGRVGREEQGPLETMFDMWLGALYAVHDSLTGNSESDYEGELVMEELD